MILSSKMNRFGVEVFTGLDIKRKELEERGRRVYNLSIGTPDIEPPEEVRAALNEASKEPGAWKYALYDLPEMTEAVISHYKKRFSVSLTPELVTSCSGTQTALLHVFLALCDPGDTVLLPDPGYPGFLAAAYIAQVCIQYYPLVKENGFVPDLSSIPEDVAKAAKMIVVNLPSNPLGTTAPSGFYDELAEWARKYDVFVVSDNPYRDMVFDGAKGESFLEAEGATDVGIELFSLSKTYCITGARIGFVAGNQKAIDAVRTIREHIDFGMFIPLQRAAVAALSLPLSYAENICSIYEERRDVFCGGLRSAGWDVADPKGAFFVWCPIPEGFSSSMEFCDVLLEKTGILCTPGPAFGSGGEGYVRFALVDDKEILAEAAYAIKESGL
ncbi:MAG: aminotransferase class I/II-fold pyridoxal phosphate-dependent enzyme [Lachnospiraceae bacterium]|nr:aminotransferase class I/II-fold pyridoxal phosphate-dependent enzyme [Lachnospiraceae bacterium]